jgi:hypothetical protein
MNALYIESENPLQIRDWKPHCIEKNIADIGQESSMVTKKLIWLPYVVELLQKGAKNGP